MAEIHPQYGDSDFNYPNMATLRWAVNRHPNWFSATTQSFVSFEPTHQPAHNPESDTLEPK